MKNPWNGPFPPIAFACGEILAASGERNGEEEEEQRTNGLGKSSPAGNI
jgi:hypothetical protein